MLCFRLADRLKEPDVRKIADLPLALLYSWLAYYELVSEAEKDTK